MRILVIGIGSLVMKDDGVGSLVVGAIVGDLQSHGIASFVGETDSQCCFEQILPDDFVVIVDAMAGGIEPGSIEIMNLTDALENRGRFCTQHEFGLLDLIALHLPKTPGAFIGIEAAEIGFGFELSAPLKDRFEAICGNVRNAVLGIKEEQNARHTSD